VPGLVSANNIELIFGFVGPTGVDLTSVCEALETQLKAADYEVFTISLSQIILNFTGNNSFRGEFARIKALMDSGDALREKFKQSEIVARMGVFELRRIRKEISGDEMKPHKTRRIAYIVRSFKRPEEVELYRDIYGKAFTLISVYGSRISRIQNLSRRCQSDATKDHSAEELAVQLVTRDFQGEGTKFGQRVSRTFPLADFFVKMDNRPELGRHFRRLVRLTLGDPYISPTRDEQGMFFAQSAALRSMDLSRQVGASIIDHEGDLLTTGCNEVPKAGGGLYWAEDPDCTRDYELGHDSNVTIKTELVKDAVRRLKDKRWLAGPLRRIPDEKLAELSLLGADPFFKDSKLFDVIEFGRAVHAEMAAISQAARRGVGLQNARLFCTTFPCHICARHIVSSGIKEVVFIEPYEKSRAGELFADSISVEPHEASTRKSNFRAFVGVAPRRYMHFFQKTHDRKTEAGNVLRSDAMPEDKIRRFIFTYTAVEAMVVDVLPEVFGQEHAP
jgi:cytidine deaminase